MNKVFIFTMLLLSLCLAGCGVKTADSRGGSKYNIYDTHTMDKTFLIEDVLETQTTDIVIATFNGDSVDCSAFFEIDECLVGGLDLKAKIDAKMLVNNIDKANSENAALIDGQRYLLLLNTEEHSADERKTILLSNVCIALNENGTIDIDKSFVIRWYDNKCFKLIEGSEDPELISAFTNGNAIDLMCNRLKKK